MEKSDVEKEIDAIRLELYEETKHMTKSERVAFFYKQAALAGEKYGFKLSNRQPPPKKSK